MAVDPGTIGAVAGGAAVAAGAAMKMIQMSKAAKRRDSEIIETLKAVKDLFVPPQPSNGKGKSDGIPGFAPECVSRAKEHGERIRRNETKIEGIDGQLAKLDARFDGVNAKIENVRKDLKDEIAAGFREMKREISKS